MALNEANFYIGFEGIKTAYEHTYDQLKSGEEYLVLGIPKEQPEVQHTYWRKDHQRRVRAGIRCKLLFNKDSEPQVLLDRNTFKGCDARYMPIDIITPAFFLIYKDTTVISTQFPKSIAVEIVNQDIADSFRGYFDAFWKESRPFKG